jgi:hypothetical protein
MRSPAKSRPDIGVGCRGGRTGRFGRTIGHIPISGGAASNASLGCSKATRSDAASRSGSSATSRCPPNTVMPCRTGAVSAASARLSLGRGAQSRRRSRGYRCGERDRPPWFFADGGRRRPTWCAARHLCRALSVRSVPEHFSLLQHRPAPSPVKRRCRLTGEGTIALDGRKGIDAYVDAGLGSKQLKNAPRPLSLGCHVHPRSRPCSVASILASWPVRMLPATHLTGG